MSDSNPQTGHRRWRSFGATALIIDDEADVRGALAALLRSAGLDTISASNGREGLELLPQLAGKQAVVLLDLSMPGLGGLDVLREIRKQYRQLPVILISGGGFGGPGDPETFGPADVGPYEWWLAKPCGVELLIETVRRALEPPAEPDR